MALGYVLVTVAPQKELEIHEKLQKVDGITEIHGLFGEYDFIAKVEAEDFGALGKLITDRIKTLEGVISTQTLTALQF